MDSTIFSQSAAPIYGLLELDCLHLHCLLCLGCGKSSLADFVLLLNFLFTMFLLILIFYCVLIMFICQKLVFKFCKLFLRSKRLSYDGLGKN
jgi:hypothetical protein